MLWSFSLNLSLVLGPAVAGLLVASFGGPSMSLIDAGTFAVMAFAAITLPVLPRSKLLCRRLSQNAWGYVNFGI